MCRRFPVNCASSVVTLLAIATLCLVIAQELRQSAAAALKLVVGLSRGVALASNGDTLLTIATLCLTMRQPA